MRGTALCALAVTVFLTAGCVQFRRNIGRPLPSDHDLQTGLEVGSTTKAETLAWLGAPLSLRRQHDGDLLIWNRAHEWSDTLILVPLVTIYYRALGEARWDRLALLFDHDGVLKGVGVNRDIDPQAPDLRRND
jgi:hypothetical protein